MSMTDQELESLVGQLKQEVSVREREVKEAQERLRVARELLKGLADRQTLQKR